MKRKTESRVDALLAKFARQERKFLSVPFLAPAVVGGRVRVQIAGVSCALRIEPADFEGWGIFLPLSHSEAVLDREATLAERREYLKLFPRFSLIVCRQKRRRWFGASARFGDSRLQLDGLAPVLLPDDIQAFETVCARFDGESFWFDEIDRRQDAATANYLREAIAERKEVAAIARRGLTAEQRAAYELCLWDLEQAEASSREKRRKIRDRLSVAAIDPHDIHSLLSWQLSHAGAKLISYAEKADTYRVTFHVDGRRYNSAVNKHDLGVQVAGICLSGEDHKFDLASLVGVLRQGSSYGHLLPIGDDGMTEEQYWRMHPPTEDYS